MNDDLVKRLRASCDSCKLWDGYKCCLKGECTAQTRLQAADAIEELRAKVDLHKEVIEDYRRANMMLINKFPKWIPVTERLPEKQGWCVACVFYRGIQWGDITTKGFTSVCPAYYFEGTFHKVSSEAEVTHWMPLPEPPEKESEV